MEQEFFNALDSWEVISLFVSFLVVSIAIYRWLMVRWQSDVNLKKYVLIHGIPNRIIDAPFDVQLEVPSEQEVKLFIANDRGIERSFHNGRLSAGSHSIRVDCLGMESGRYALTITTDGQEDIKMFEWKA